MLKLPGVARTFESLARQARDSHWPHEDYLHEVLRAEEASRHESVIRQRLREARFPEVKTLDTFDFTTAEGVSATRMVQAILSLDETPEPSHAADALAVAICHALAPPLLRVVNG